MIDLGLYLRIHVLLVEVADVFAPVGQNQHSIREGLPALAQERSKADVYAKVYYLFGLRVAQ